MNDTIEQKETNPIMANLEPLKDELGEISLDEKQQIAQFRAMKAKREECAAKIDQVLQECNAVLTIDPQSLLRNPQIIVQLR